MAMRKRLIIAAGFVSVLLITSAQLFAHHGNAAFDTEKRITVKDDQGNVVHWIAEASNPAAMISRGWNARDVKVGDEVTLTLIVARNGAPVGRVQQLILANGRKLAGDAANTAVER